MPKLSKLIISYYHTGRTLHSLYEDKFHFIIGTYISFHKIHNETPVLESKVSCWRTATLLKTETPALGFFL